MGDFEDQTRDLLEHMIGHAESANASWHSGDVQECLDSLARLHHEAESVGLAVSRWYSERRATDEFSLSDEEANFIRDLVERRGLMGVVVIKADGSPLALGEQIEASTEVLGDIPSGGYL